MNRGSAPDEIGVGAGVAHRIVVGLDGSRVGRLDGRVGGTRGGGEIGLVAVRGLLRAAVNRARGPDLDPARRGHPARCSISSGADLLVIDGSSSGTVRHLLLGSVPRTAARRSACPVIVVRGRPRPYLRRIAVGIDASNAAHQRWTGPLPRRNATVRSCCRPRMAPARRRRAFDAGNGSRSRRRAMCARPRHPSL